MAVYELEGAQYEIPDEVQGEELVNTLTLLSSKKQPTEERSFLSKAKDFVTGQSANPEGLGEITDFGTGFGNELKIAAGLLASVDPEAQADIIRKNVPGAIVEKDDRGNYIVEKDGQRGFINRPGLSPNDVTQTVAQGLAFYPAAKLGSLANKLALRIGLTGSGAAATSVAADKFAQTLGSDQPVSAGRAAISGVLGGVFEGLSPLAAKGWAKLFSNKNLVKNGNLTEKGLEAARKAGLDADDLTDELVDAFSKYAREIDQGIDLDTVVAVSRSKGFDVPLTKGQLTQNFDQLAKEEAIRRSALGQKGGQLLRDFDTLQSQRVTSAADRLQSSLSRGVSQISRENQGGGIVAEGLKRKSDTLKQQINEAFEAAGETKAFLRLNDTESLVRNAKVALKGRVIDGELTPATIRAMDDLNKLITPTMGKARVRAVSLKKLELARRRLNQFLKTSKNPTDKANVLTIKKEFDNWLDDAFDNALFTGDQKSLELLKKARGLRAQYGRQFSERGPKDRVGKVVESIVELDATPEQTVDFLLGRSRLGGKRESARVAKRLKEVLGPDSDEFNALREMAFLRLTRGPQASKGFSPARFVKDVDDAINGNGESLMKELFSPKELAQFKSYAGLVKRTVTPQGATNPSGTAFSSSRLVQEAIDRVALAIGLSGDPLTGAAIGATAKATGRGAVKSAKEAISGVRPLPPKAPGFTAGATGTTAQSLERIR